MTRELSFRAQVLEGGPAMWEQLMAELRQAHLGVGSTGDGRSVAEQLQAACEDLCGRAAA